MTEDYCKLASGIILSTIWREDDHTRILWITMLALKDRLHRVHASIPGLATVANLPVDSVRNALSKLMEPDPDSRTKEQEGRRIQEIEGGWFIVNGEKYRNYLSKAERNEYQAKLMADRRAKVKKLAHVSKKLAVLAQTETEAETKKSTAQASPSLTGFDEFWKAYPKRVGKANAEKAWRKLGCAAISQSILSAVQSCKRSPDWTKESGEFIPHPATWLNRRGWEDELTPRNNGGRSGEWLPSKLLRQEPALTDEEREAAAAFQKDAAQRGIVLKSKLNQLADDIETGGTTP